MKLNESIEITNEDNLELMARYEDNYFDLAIVDPPYGIGESGQTNKTRGKLTKSKDYGSKNWDISSPEIKYFNELKRVSKNQIIWGANHFIEKLSNANSSCWIVWDKDNGATDFADSELAHTTFKTAVRNFKFKWQGMLQQDMKNKEIRIHPTQKPVKLYEWLLKNYASEGQKILDTHLGSGSIAIALNNMNTIEKMNLTLTACELDEEYYNNSIKRIKKSINQLTIF
jgi:site-specific DNA-methyltransferase (adenine-specific)